MGLYYYQINHQLLNLMCNKGHECKIRFDNFKAGTRCAICSSKRKYSFNDVCNYIKSHNYQIITKKKDYENGKTKINLICSNEHEYITSFHAFKQGYRCPKCKFSGEEKEVLSYVRKFYDGEIIENDKKQIINPNTNHWLELDIWIPELKKAIEYNGYYHTLKENAERDAIKKEQCNLHNINLLVINSEDWKKHKDKTINKLQNFVTA